MGTHVHVNEFLNVRLNPESIQSTIFVNYLFLNMKGIQNKFIITQHPIIFNYTQIDVLKNY